MDIELQDVLLIGNYADLRRCTHIGATSNEIRHRFLRTATSANNVSIVQGLLSQTFLKEIEKTDLVKLALHSRSYDMLKFFFSDRTSWEVLPEYLILACTLNGCKPLVVLVGHSSYSLLASVSDRALTVAYLKGNKGIVRFLHRKNIFFTDIDRLLLVRNALKNKSDSDSAYLLNLLESKYVENQNIFNFTCSITLGVGNE